MCVYICEIIQCVVVPRSKDITKDGGGELLPSVDVV